MITVAWPSSVAERANVWRLLDLSGLTKSVRQSRNYTKAGYVYLNGHVVTLSTTVVIGSKITLEIRFPNGLDVSEEIMLVSRPSVRKPRSNTPRILHRRG